MGRKKKYGEKSKMVSVRVPESKEKEYRQEINKFVDEKFEKNEKLAIDTTKILPKNEQKPFSNSNFEQNNSKTIQKAIKSKEFQDLREFVNKLYKDQKEKKDH